MGQGLCYGPVGLLEKGNDGGRGFGTVAWST